MVCVFLCAVVIDQSLSGVWLFCNPTDCSPPGSSVHRISQARMLEWVAISFSSGFSQPRDWTHISCIDKEVLYHWATKEAPFLCENITIPSKSFDSKLQKMVPYIPSWYFSVYFLTRTISYITWYNHQNQKTSINIILASQTPVTFHRLSPIVSLIGLDPKQDQVLQLDQRIS